MSSLLREPFVILADIVYALQVCLDDLERMGRFTTISLLIKLCGKRSQINFLCQVDLRPRLLLNKVEGVCKVLKSDEDFVFVKWEQPISALGLEAFTEFPRESEQLLVFSLGYFLLETSSIVEDEEILQWLLDVQLLLSLQ